MNVLKNFWTGVVNLGWIAIAVALFSRGDGSQPARADPKATAPQVAQEVPPPPAAEKAVPKAAKQDVDRINAEIQVEAERIRLKQAEMQRLVEQAGEEAEETPPPPPRWVVNQINPTPAPNLHETHEPGEPYEYSLARYQNNELRWTINEFHWRLRDPINQAKEYWDLTEVDRALKGALPNDIMDLRKQNWNLSWRASQLLAIFNGEPPSARMPAMPRGDH